MSQNSNFSEETLYENGNGYKKFSCNLCEFTNTNKGGMKRHIDARHKNSGNKRAHEDSNDCNDPDKRPKIDEDFEPSLASTQIMMDEDDENDDLDEFLLADQNDLDLTSATIAGFSNETLARLGADETTNIEEPEAATINTHQDIQTNPILNAMMQADLAITNGRLKFMESDSKAKDLLLAEKELELNNLRLEVMDLNDKMGKKDNALETNIAKLNSVEDQLEESKSKTNKIVKKLSEAEERIKLLQKGLKKYMNKASPGSPPKAATSDDEEVKKLKVLLKQKIDEIKGLINDKIHLANELTTAQETTNGNALTERCTKLTNDLKAKTTAMKALEKENNHSKDTLGKLQMELNNKNNKNAFLEAQNVKVNDFNNKMYELCKKSSIFEKLEAINVNEIKSQKQVYDPSKNSGKAGFKQRYGNKPDNIPENTTKTKSSEHCWHFENGFCKKGGGCEFQHPMKMCPAFWKFGECQQAGECPDRHPVKVCTRFLNGDCKAGNSCVQQHPMNQTKKPELSQPPKSPGATFNPVESTSYFNLGFGNSYLNPNTPQFHAQQSPTQAGPPLHVQQPAQQCPQPHQQYSAQGNFYSHPGQSLGQGWQL